jgi:hypothetical protein
MAARYTGWRRGGWRTLLLALALLCALALGMATMTQNDESIRVRRAQLAPGRIARIVARRGLYYRDGADAALDRPAHVRAASGIAWLGERLALVQDDAHFVALVSPESGAAEAIPLPADAQGRRLFDDTRGTKHLKLDLEACFAVHEVGTSTLVALGSGSQPAREKIAVLSYDHGSHAATALRVLDASSLYRLLRETVAFSGSELNLEGALHRGDTVLLFQRGNGAARDGRLPLNAVAELAWPAFARYLESDGRGELPALDTITQYDLGNALHVPYTFTDATLAPDGKVVFLASAEDSSSTVEDGAVHGTYVGELARDGSALLTPLLDEQGRPARIKAEGIALDPGDPARAWLVVDMDDPALASELLEVRLATAD